MNTIAPQPLPVASRPAHNLPLQLTSFIGRERAMVEVKRLLAKSRLLTLTAIVASCEFRQRSDALNIVYQADAVNRANKGRWH